MGASVEFELERQLLAKVDGFVSPHGVPCKLLDGTPAPAIDMRCAFSLPFKDLSEVVARSVPVLYRPVSKTFGCDAILMSAASDPHGVVLISNCSTTIPTDAERLRKQSKLLGEGGAYRVLIVDRSDRKGLIVFAFDGVLPVVDALSDAVMAFSHGKPLSSASTSAGKGRPKKATKATATGVTGVGDVTRVVDANSLMAPLHLLL